MSLSLHNKYLETFSLRLHLVLMFVKFCLSLNMKLCCTGMYSIEGVGFSAII